MEGLHWELSPLVHTSSIPAKATMTAAKQLQALWALWASDGTLVAFQYHFIRIYSVFRSLSHGIFSTNLMLYYCTGIYSGAATSQLCCSPVLAPDVFELLCLVIGVFSMLQVGVGPLPSSPDQVRAKLQSLARGEAGRQRATGWGLGQHVCRLARKASSGQRAGVRVRGPLRKGLPRTGVRGDLCVGTADRLLAAGPPNSHPWQWRNDGSRQVVTQGLSRDGRSAKAD